MLIKEENDMALELMKDLSTRSIQAGMHRVKQQILWWQLKQPEEEDISVNVECPGRPWRRRETGHCMSAVSRSFYWASLIGRLIWEEYLCHLSTPSPSPKSRAKMEIRVSAVALVWHGPLLLLGHCM